MPTISRHAEKIDNITFEVVIYICVNAGLGQQHGRSATEKLNINPMRWKMAHDPGRKGGFASVINHRRYYPFAHFSTGGAFAEHALQWI